ncbi:MAG: threonine/serine exporter family protein [Limosilactobacillus sp.]|nr:threonine/serine exporter family protein [Limosilactobacillus sp.]
MTTVPWWIQGGLSFVAAVTFGMMLNIPKRAYIPSGLIGTVCWLAYLLINQWWHLGLALSNMIGAVLISIFSMLVARRQRLPMIIYNVPALVNFVPGGQSYRMIRALALGNQELAMTYLYQVLVIAGALSVGFGLGDLINAAIFGRKFIGPKPISQLLRPKPHVSKPRDL